MVVLGQCEAVDQLIASAKARLKRTLRGIERCRDDLAWRQR
jgi:hypothetical protein